jgi:thiol-disulfide isomerase/thioredoxin
MTKRWILATIAVLGLAYMMVPGLPVWSPWGERAEAADGAVCPAGAKKANLGFTLNDMNGTPVKLSAYKGKVILLDFWATWCGPCKLEIPHFVELQQQYGPQGLVVLGFSVDDTVDKLKPFASELRMNYPVLVGLGRDDVQEAFGPLWGIPVSYIIGRDGKICKKHMGIAPKAQFEREIKALL